MNLSEIPTTKLVNELERRGYKIESPYETLLQKRQKGLELGRITHEYIGTYFGLPQPKP